MWVPLVVLGCWAASHMWARARRERTERSWRALAPAVPDQRALPSADAYRSQLPVPLESSSRKSLELSESSRRAMRNQEWIAIASAPLTALVFGLFPAGGIAAGLSALFGGLWGLASGAANLDDSRRGLTLLGASLFLSGFALIGTGTALPLSFAALLTAVGTLFANRFALDQKDAAGQLEGERERLADPVYLTGSKERRAGALARSRGGGGDSTAVSARDNLGSG